MSDDSFDVELDVYSYSSSVPSFLNKLDLSSDVKNRLSSYLKSLVDGSDSIVLSAIGENYNPSVLLGELDELFDLHKTKINDNLRTIESSNRSKFGPRSISKPWSERYQALSEYFDDDRPYSFNPFTFNVGGNHARPISRSSAISYLKNKTNSGLPYFLKKDAVRNKILRMSDDQFTKELLKEYPCILFTRTQEGNKTRDVWGYPIFDTINEMRYYVPLLAFQRRALWRAAIRDPEAVDLAISNLVFKCIGTIGLTLVSIDFKSFDRSVLTGVSSSAFDYVKNIFQSSYHPEIDFIKYRFQNIGIVTPSGVFSGPHGIPSGSTFTNEIDSIVQYLIAKSSNTVIDTNCQIQGDDGVYLIRTDDCEKLIDTFRKAGLKVSDKIQDLFSSDHCIYLQRLYDIHYADNSGFIGGIYSLYRALCRIVYQERFVDFLAGDLDGKDYYSIRTICILENCKYHPLFEEFVKFIYSKDKYLLSYSEKSLSKYSRLINKGPGTGGVLNNQYGDDIKGLSSFETVKIIKSLA